MAKIRVKNVKASEAAAKVEDAAKKGTKAGKRKLRGKPVAKPKVKFAKLEKPAMLTPEQRKEKEHQIAVARAMGAQKYGHVKLGVTLGDLISMTQVESSELPRHLKKTFKRNMD